MPATPSGDSAQLPERSRSSIRARSARPQAQAASDAAQMPRAGQLGFARVSPRSSTCPPGYTPAVPTSCADRNSRHTPVPLTRIMRSHAWQHLPRACQAQRFHALHAAADPAQPYMAAHATLHRLSYLLAVSHPTPRSRVCKCDKLKCVLAVSHPRPNPSIEGQPKQALEGARLPGRCPARPAGA